MGVTVYDPDGFNPYGRELAALLADAGTPSTLLCPRDVEWRPRGLDIRAVLAPVRLERGRPQKAVALLRGLGALLLRAARGETVVVVWTWYALEELVLLVAALMGARVVVIAHNPGNRERLSGPRLSIRDRLAKAARVVVVHSHSLVPGLPHGIAPSRVAVCRHPPYKRYLAEHLSRRVRTDASAEVRLLLLGALRRDKGADLIPRVLERVSPEVRAQLVIEVVGRDPDLGSDLVTAMRDLVSVECEVHRRYVSDLAVVEALTRSHALLALYPEATQSGTVVLALSAGVPAIAYAVGALPEIVPENCLVPVGDVTAAAHKIEALATGRLRCHSPDLGDWSAEAARDWELVLALAGARG